MGKVSRSTILVVAQLTFLFYLFVTGPIIPSNFLALLLLLAGVAIGTWAVYAFRGTKFNIKPEIPEGAALITQGPYTYVRHPMYLAMLLVSFALLLNVTTFDRLIAFVALIFVLIQKLQMEEGYLNTHFTDYGTYTRKTKKLIPYVY